MKNKSYSYLSVAVLILGLSVCGPLQAQERGSAPPAFSPKTIREQLEFLTSDALAGRGSGEPGNEKAAQFIARQFALYGLKPMGTKRQRDPQATLDGSGYFQPFLFPAGRAPDKGNELELTSGKKVTRYRADQDFVVSDASNSGEATGEVVYVGYGIKTPDGKYDDYGQADVKDKIILLLAGSPKSEANPDLANYASIRSKARTARDLGVKAILVVLPKEADTLERTSSDFALASDSGLPVLRLRRSVANAWAQASHTAGSTAAVSLDALQDLTDRTPGKVSFTLPGKVTLKTEVKQIQRVSANIIGLIEGSDPVLKNEVVVIGAHMDHLGMGGVGSGSLDNSDKPAIHHGADDNASGTSGVLALSRLFGSDRRMNPAGAPGSRTIPRLKRSLLLMCYSGEERGLLGSQHYVTHPIIPLEKTVAMLNMDMIGRLRENNLTIIGTGSATEWNLLLDELNRATGFTLSRSASGLGGSDHQSFFMKGVPVLFFFTGMHGQYHRPTDTVDTINVEGIGKVLQLVRSCAEYIANDPARPIFQKGQETTTPAPSRGFRVYFGSMPNYTANVEGVLFDGVREGSPAAKAGLKAGDILIKFGNKTVRNVEEYVTSLMEYKPGDTVEVVVKRGTETLTVKVTLTERRG